MEIELKNGEKLILEVSSLFLEYIEDYPGGINQLEVDANDGVLEDGYTTSMTVTNHLLYSMIASNYDKEISYRQAVKLVKLDDIPKILDFIIRSIPEMQKDALNKKTVSSRKHRF